MRLTKHHGLGNDFLVAFDPGVEDLPALARRLCDRRRGIGADGLLVGESEEGVAARMLLFNADGRPSNRQAKRMLDSALSSSSTPYSAGSRKRV